MKNYATLSETTSHLQQQGFSDRFKLEGDRLENLETGALYTPEDLKVVELHRFEGMTNPGDMSVLFAVETKDGRKGSIISSYGTYANDALLHFMDEVERVS